ncbi:hypothetical protein NDU88_000932 [Pleurodeles waltl]|uniref:Uncharacterized protein n=1 Tax=Pleurodeles waltl TaxID=8319 RepID=A0AAV7KPL7_PLEWA|nr:hypothetical protein NDU88_000932 [Pleurodeles waltl]
MGPPRGLVIGEGAVTSLVSPSSPQSEELRETFAAKEGATETRPGPVAAEPSQDRRPGDRWAGSGGTRPASPRRSTAIGAAGGVGSSAWGVEYGEGAGVQA